MVMFYRKPVIGLVTRSITEFSINVEHNTPPHRLLPDIWVDGKRLYQYQTLTTLGDGERWRYMLTYYSDNLLAPYEYDKSFDPLIQCVLQDS